MLVCILDYAPEWQELYVFELDVACSVVFAFAWVEIGDNAVSDVSVVVHYQNILEAYVLVVQQRLAQVPDDLIKVSIALETLDPERDPRHDRLFLLDDHARVGIYLPEVEVVLHAEGQPQHQCQQQEQPGTEALYLGGKLHAKTKKNFSASDVRIVVKTML